MAGPNTDEFKPYTRNGEPLVAVGAGMPDSTYHATRKEILDMRVRDLALGRELDAYLSAEAKNHRRPEGFSDERVAKLRDNLEKLGLGLGDTTLDVARDLKAHGYSSSYRPLVMIEVGGRPMHPMVVMRDLTEHGINVSGMLVSDKAGKVSGAMSFDKGALGDAVVRKIEDFNNSDKSIEGIRRRLGHDSANIFAQVVSHSGGVASFLKHSKFAALLAVGIGVANGASAAELGQGALDAAVPGLGTLTLGEGPKKGKLCGAFGQAGGALAGVGAGLVGTGVAGPLAGVGAGMLVEAGATPALTAGCERVVDGPLANGGAVSYSQMNGANIGHHRPSVAVPRGPGV